MQDSNLQALSGPSFQDWWLTIRRNPPPAFVSCLRALRDATMGHMRVVISEWVREFIDTLDAPVGEDVYNLIDLLKEYGHTLSMPHAKPIGGGLRELRRTGRPQVHILYGYCKGDALLLLGVKKQRSALRKQDIVLAQKRLGWYCET